MKGKEDNNDGEKSNDGYYCWQLTAQLQLLHVLKLKLNGRYEASEWLVIVPFTVSLPPISVWLIDDVQYIAWVVRENS